MITPRSARWRAAAAGAVLAVLPAAIAGAGLVGSSLIVEEHVRPADAIVVMNGETPDRVDEAIALHREGWAPEIWLTQLPDSDDLATRIASGDVVDGGTRFNVERLRTAGVPMSAVRVLPEPVRNTAQELEAIARVARARHLSSMIVVTSAPHTRRTRFIWDRVIGVPPIVVRHPRDSRWALTRWWRDRETRGAVMHEIGGLLVAFIQPRTIARTQ